MAGLLASGGIFSPAYAGDADIAYCSVQPDPDECRGAVWGVRSTISVQNYSLPYPDVSKSISSIYIYQHDPETYCCPSSENYIEFGWKRGRNLFGGSVGEWMFVCWEDDNGAGGQECNTYDGPSPRGDYIIRLYQNAGSVGTFRFDYKIPGGGWVTIPFTKNPAGSWNNGFPAWGLETQAGSEMPDGHDNCYLLDSYLNPTGWVPANGALGVTALFDDNPDYNASVFQGSGTTGDSIVTFLV